MLLALAAIPAHSVDVSWQIKWWPQQQNGLKKLVLQCGDASVPAPANGAEKTLKEDYANSRCSFVGPVSGASKIYRMRLEVSDPGDYKAEKWITATVTKYVPDLGKRYETLFAVVGREELSGNLLKVLNQAPVNNDSYSYENLIIVVARFGDALRNGIAVAQKDKPVGENASVSDLLYQSYVSVAVRHLQAARRLARDFRTELARDDYTNAYSLVELALDQKPDDVRKWEVGTVADLRTLLSDVNDLTGYQLAANLVSGGGNCGYWKQAVMYHDSLSDVRQPKFRDIVFRIAKVDWADAVKKASSCAA